MSIIVSGSFDQGGSCTIFGRIMAEDGTGTPLKGEGKAVKIADVSNIHYTIHALTGPPETILIVNSQLSPVSSYMYDTLQTATDNPAWGGDSVGFNFRYKIPVGTLPFDGRSYLIEVKFTMVSGTVAYARWQVVPVKTHI